MTVCCEFGKTSEKYPFLCARQSAAIQEEGRRVLPTVSVAPCSASNSLLALLFRNTLSEYFEVLQAKVLLENFAETIL